MGKGIEQITEMLKVEGVRQQLLHSSVFEAKINKREKCTEIHFGTRCADVLDAVSADKVVGLILWIPRKEYDEITKVDNNEAD